MIFVRLARFLLHISDIISLTKGEFPHEGATGHDEDSEVQCYHDRVSWRAGAIEPELIDSNRRSQGRMAGTGIIRGVRPRGGSCCRGACSSPPRTSGGEQAHPVLPGSIISRESPPDERIAEHPLTSYLFPFCLACPGSFSCETKALPGIASCSAAFDSVGRSVTLRWLLTGRRECRQT